jgi:spore photoproduct lyase
MSITRLCIDPQIADLPATIAFIERSGLEPEWLSNPTQAFDQIKSASDPWHAAKQTLVLMRNKGSFLKECPGTKEYTCCGYQILHIGSYCTMDCAYCILQSYFHPPVLQFFVNHDDLMDELDQALNQPKIRRIGTGEFTDSLIWEKWSDLTPRLIQKVAGQNTAVLELKTKTTAIDQLQGLNHHRKTIISWSLNTPRIIRSQERGTASLEARLAAAAKCHSWGYPLAFHFDPMVIYPGCESEYRQVLEILFQSIPAHAVVWISLGTFRFMPVLKGIIEQRFADSDIIYGEFIPGLDGKMRYFKPIRTRLYASMVRWIGQLAPNTTSYLCMEDDPVWMKSYGFIPASKGGLSAMLDRCVEQHCGVSASPVS